MSGSRGGDPRGRSDRHAPECHSDGAPPPLSRVEAVAAYLAGEPSRSVAARTRLNPVTGRPFTANAVLRWVRGAGHETRRPGPAPAIAPADLLRLVEGGHAYAAVARMYGLSAQAVHEQYMRVKRSGRVIEGGSSGGGGSRR